MPYYVYESLTDSDRRFEFQQSIHDDPFTEHPETGEPMKKIIVAGASIRLQGIKKSTKVNKLSPAATACGCASTAALDMLGMSKTTPRYGDKAKSVVAGHSHGKGHGHQHGGSCGHKH